MCITQYVYHSEELKEELKRGIVSSRHCQARGRGLRSARVGHSAAFTIHAFDALGLPVRKGSLQSLTLIHTDTDTETQRHREIDTERAERDKCESDRHREIQTDRHTQREREREINIFWEKEI